MAIGVNWLCAGGVDVVWGQLRVQVAPPDSFLQAQVVWHFVGQTQPLMPWDLGAGLRLTGVESSWGIDTFWHDTLARKVWLRFSRVPQGELGWVRVRYEGYPRSSGFGSYEVRAHATGWCLWTLSQPYGAPDWLFCRDGLEDKVDSLDFVVGSPPSYLGVANGRLVTDSVGADGWRYRHFRHRYPIAVYLIAFAVSNYVVQEVPVETAYHRFILRNYVYPQDTAVARRLSEQFMPYFRWIEDRLGPYPFAAEDYQQVQIGWPGGMEHQTMTFFGSYTLELWAHELAHQWFGDWVTCGSWQDIWLNEAFATYLGGAVYEALGWPEVWQLWRRLTIKAAWRDTVHTIWVEDTTDVWRIFSYWTTYAKGAMALDAARRYVGEGPFWSGLQAYLRRYGAGFARTADFAAAVQSYWGLEVSRAFVEGWIYTPGYPKVSWERRGEGALGYQANRSWPLRVPWRAVFPNDTGVGEVDLMQPGTLVFPSPLVRLVLDPDTVTLLWSVREVKGGAAAVWPNPFSQGVLIEVSDESKVRLLDITGREVARAALRGPSPAFWDLSFLAPGPYLLQMDAPAGVRTYRLIKVP